MKIPVNKRKRTVEGITCATGVVDQDTKELTVAKLQVVNKSSKRPKYLRESIWFSADKQSHTSPTAICTPYNDPLPRPPDKEFDNIKAITTIKHNPHLF